MHDVPELVDGYRRFLEGRYPQEAALYQTLAEAGQEPKTMVIACCDSRVDPAAIFSAGPGQLFIVRNVANLVPPHETHGSQHGTSAALEFAVTGLQVENILVLGHGRCGGVKAYLEGIHDWSSKRTFIGRWMMLLNAARTEALQKSAGASAEEQQLAMEYAAIRHSIENLATFPFIKERVADGRLRLRGAHFDIAHGRLVALDPDSGHFVPVEA